MSTPAAPDPTGRPPLRIADQDRIAAADALAEHFATGRLDREEYDERVERVWSARTAPDLQPLFFDLPAPHPPTLGTPRGAPAHPPLPSRLPAGAGQAGGGRGFRFPLGFVLLVALGLALFAEIGWPVFVLLGVLWWTGLLRPRRRRTHASGSERSSRGSCW